MTISATISPYSLGCLCFLLLCIPILCYGQKVGIQVNGQSMEVNFKTALPSELDTLFDQKGIVEESIYKIKPDGYMWHHIDFRKVFFREVTIDYPQLGLSFQFSNYNTRPDKLIDKRREAKKAKVHLVSIRLYRSKVQLADVQFVRMTKEELESRIRFSNQPVKDEKDNGTITYYYDNSITVIYEQKDDELIATEFFFSPGFSENELQIE